MKLPTDDQLRAGAIEASYTPEGYNRLLLFVGVMPGDGYIPVMKRLAILDALTEPPILAAEQARVFNRQAAGQSPPDMPKQGIKVFDHQSAIPDRQRDSI